MFKDRTEAGFRLADELTLQRFREPLVLAPLVGGIAVAFPVAQRIQAELDLLLVRTLKVPGHEGFCMGAVALGAPVLLHEPTVRTLSIPDSVIRAVITEEQELLFRRSISLRGTRVPPRVRNRSVIIVDEGVISGSNARVMLRSIREQKPATLTLAVPIGVHPIVQSLRQEALVDEVVLLEEPEACRNLADWYEEFDDVSDSTIRHLLASASRPAYIEEAPAALRSFEPART